VDVVEAQAWGRGEQRGTGGLVGEDVDGALVDVHWRGRAGWEWGFGAVAVLVRVAGAPASAEEVEGVHCGWSGGCLVGGDGGYCFWAVFLLTLDGWMGGWQWEALNWYNCAEFVEGHEWE
jgi:hypothetical protein